MPICHHNYCSYAIGRLPIPDIPALTPSLGTAVLITDMTTGFLLIATFCQERRLSLILLGCAYLYAGSMAALNLVTFPGILLRDVVILGTSQSSAWALMLFWVGYGLLTLSAVVIESIPSSGIVVKGDTALIATVSLASLAVVVIGNGLLITRFIELLPPLIQGSAFTSAVWVPRGFSIVVLLLGVTLGMFVAGRRSRVFLWLCFSLTTLLCVNILTLTSGGRSTLGWSLGRISWMLSSSVLFFFFMGQFTTHLRFLSRVKESLEARVKERTTDLAYSLQQRDLLLREVYHRVKNNMQIIDSILFLERRRITDAPVQDMIDTLRNRVMALGLVHQQLMVSKDMTYFGLSTFIQELVQNLSVVENVKTLGIALNARIEEVDVDLDFAIPIGLLITELVTNSLKHAYAKHICVSFQRCGDNLGKLIVENDGDDANTNDSEFRSGAISTGQGSRIVMGFVRQLGGQLQVTRDNGMLVQIVVPLPIRDIVT